MKNTIVRVIITVLAFMMASELASAAISSSNISVMSALETSCVGANVSHHMYLQSGATSVTIYPTDNFRWVVGDVNNFAQVLESTTRLSIWQGTASISCLSGWYRGSWVIPGDGQWYTAVFRPSDMSACSIARPVMPNPTQPVAQFVYKVAYKPQTGFQSGTSGYYYILPGQPTTRLTPSTVPNNTKRVWGVETVHPNECQQYYLSYCGDGVRDTGRIFDNGITPTEQCDDGNNVSGDGCSATCQLETTAGPSCAAVTPNQSITNIAPNTPVTYTCSSAGFTGSVANLEYNIACGAGDATATWTGSATRVCTTPAAASATQAVSCGVRDRTNTGAVFSGSFVGSCSTVATTSGGGGGGGYVGKICINNVASCATYNTQAACSSAGAIGCWTADSVGLGLCQRQDLTCGGGGGGGGGGYCGDGVLQVGEECDVSPKNSVPWCVDCKLKITTTPGANPITDLWMTIPTLAGMSHLGYNWVDGQAGKIKFENNSMIIGVGTKAFTLADRVGFGIDTKFLVPLMIEADKKFCLSSSGDALNSQRICTSIGTDTTGLETWTRYDGKKYVILGQGDYQIPQPDHTYIGAVADSANSVNLFRGSQIYGVDGGGSLTLNSAFWGNAVGNDGVITLSTLASADGKTDIPLVSLSVRVSGALVGTTSTPVNRSIQSFVTQSGIHDFISSITNDSTTTSTTTTATSSSSIAPVNVNITSAGDVTTTKLDDIPPFNGNENIRAVKGNLTINCPAGATTFVMEGVRTILVEGNLTLNCNTSYGSNDTTSSFAWIVKGGNIQVYGGDTVSASYGVTNLAGIYVAIRDGGNGGQFTPYPVNTTSQKILKVEGSLYGDATPLFNSRLYTRGTNAYEILTTGTIISYSNRALVSPPPLLSQYLNNYDVQRVIR